MGYNPFRFVLIALAAMTTCVALFGCSKERALNPQMSKLVIYVGGSTYIPGSNPSRWYSVLYALDADSLHKVDSIVLEDYPSGVATTPDGRTLFISAYDLEARTPKILAVDGTTHRTMWSLENGLYGDLGALLDLGSKMLVRYSGDSTVLINTLDGSHLTSYGDSLRFFGGKYDGTETVVTVTRDHQLYLRAIDVVTGSMRGEYRPRLQSGDMTGVSYAVLHPDGKRVLVIGCRCNSRYDTWFLLGDIETDSTLLEHQMLYRSGEIAVSKDGRWAAVTDPSDEWHESVVNLSIIDMSQMRVLKRFVEPEVRMPGRVRFLNDRATLAVYSASGDPGSLELVDLNSLAITWHGWMPNFDSTFSSPSFTAGPFDVAPLPR